MILIIYYVIRFLLTVNCLILTYVNGVWIVSIWLSLSWMNHSPTLDIWFLPRTSSPTSNASWIASTILRLRVEVLSCSWKRRQNVFIVVFKGFVYFWHCLISTLGLKMMHYPLMSISSWCLTSYVGICGYHGFLMLFYVRAIASVTFCNHSLFVYFLFNCT